MEVAGEFSDEGKSGKIVYGRSAMEKIEGTRGETKRVKHDEFQVFDGQHEVLVSQELWDAARAKRNSFRFCPGW